MGYLRTWTLEDNGNDNVIDPRDIDSRIDELQAERDEIESRLSEAQEQLDAVSHSADLDEEDTGDIPTPEDIEGIRQELADWDEENGDELKTLKSFYDEIRADEPLIADHYFTEYAQYFCEDISGEIPSYIVVDWEATADGLKVDYYTYTLDGTDYLQRA
jgi:hypothetical protein